MAQKNWNAGIIRPVPVAPAGPYQDGAAKGIWTLDQVAYWQKQGLWPIAGNVAPRGLFMGGYGVTYRATIDYITIPTTGNATTFGNLTNGRQSLSSCASTTRACAAGGESASGRVATIDYVTIFTTGNATSFGSLSSASNYGSAGCNSSTRGIFWGGIPTNNSTGTNINYITIATTGNATSFGSLSQFTYTAGSCSSSTRGLLAGGYDAVAINTIQYITIASTGNATTFGQLTTARYGIMGASNSTRGVFAGGSSSVVIDYVTIATTGNAISFGSLSSSPGFGSGSGPSSPTRAVFMGSSGTAALYVEIATLGNSLTFGNLTVARTDLTGASSANGGTQ